jgi:hypothetical protein
MMVGSNSPMAATTISKERALMRRSAYVLNAALMGNVSNRGVRIG